MSSFYGKYRAIVVDIKDPDKMGRIKVKCPKAYGESISPWALPCTPFAFSGGGFYFIPKVGDGVWIEFEEGNTDLPIWVGSWWAKGKIPTEAYVPNPCLRRVIQFEGGQKIIMDEFGTIWIRTGSSLIKMMGDKIIIKADAVYNQPSSGVDSFM